MALVLVGCAVIKSGREGGGEVAEDEGV